MLRKLSEPLQKFFGFVGASLTGITAVFTAAGFLAERARLTMLGLPSTTFDLQLYLETGARFLAFLPLYLGMALVYSVFGFFSAILYGLAAYPTLTLVLLIVLVGGSLFLVVTRNRDWAIVRYRKQFFGYVQRGGGWILRLVRTMWRKLTTRTNAGTTSKAHPDTEKSFTVLLVLFPLIQFVGAFQMTQALEISNLLFDTTLSSSATPHLAPSIVSTETLQAWIIEGAYVNAAQYLGWLFLVTALPALGLYLLSKRYRGDDTPSMNGVQTTGFAASILLLVTQATLLPVNYGILMTANRFSEVSVVFTAPEPDAAAADPRTASAAQDPADEASPQKHPTDTRLFLIHETGGGFYFYSHAETKVWYILRGDVLSIQHHRMTRILAPQ